ncbi:unnamed protein product [Heligmosomoides polygyrus]|uniref:Lactamase_B domain-containing protein n=1 Tax=Heligmosomoides polygyrus TaxID=6339 RepID=A0A3P8AQ81_HELPZ|nr:unnamed protein product [Heligmosomoides polygyrus]
MTIIKLLRLFGQLNSIISKKPMPAVNDALLVSVCPFSADPLMLGKEFAYCRPSSVGDCPVGYLCDQSFVLGKSICCRDTRMRPMPNRPAVGESLALLYGSLTECFTSRWLNWHFRTTWPSVYNRVTSEATAPTTEEPTTTTEATTTTTTTEPVNGTSKSVKHTTTTTTAPSTTTKLINPWARVWTTTTPPQNPVAVSVLQAGSVRSLRDGQSEAVGAITLINDNGFYVLVDTGASSDTERLLHSKFLFKKY